MAKQSTIACIDIGSSKVATLIVFPSEGNEALHVVGAATSESKGIKKSQVVDIDGATGSIQESIEAAERMAGMSVGQAFISVGGSHIKSRNSTGIVAVAEPEGEVTKEDVRRVIEAARAVSMSDSEEIIHVLPRSYKVDSQEGVRDPVGMTGVRLEVEAHLVTGSSTSMKSLTKCVSDLGINIQGLVFSGLASSESVLTATEKELGVVLVDLGGGTTSIAVWIEGALSYSSVLPIGARNITNDLAIGMRQSLDVAEGVKFYLSKQPKKPVMPGDANVDRKKDDEIDLEKLGIAGEATTYSRKTLVEGIIRPRLTEMFTMAGMELKESGFGGQTPAGVVLTGGGAKTADIEAACRRTLSLPTRVGTPHTLSGLVDDIQDPAYAVTEGLVLYALEHGGVRARPMGISPKFGKLVGRIPVKGTVSKAVNFLKQFLP